MSASPVIAPQPGPQTQFLSTPADIAIYGGAAGGGKTFGLLLEGLRHVSNPRFGAVIFRRTMRQVKQEGGIWDQSCELYPVVGAKPNVTESYWTFPMGASIQFAGLEHEADKTGFQGAEICYLGFDELTHFTEGQFFYLLSRNRSTCGVRPYVRCTTNPGPGWVKRLLAPWIDKKFANPAKSGEIRWFMRGEANQIIWLDAKPERTPCDCLGKDCENCFPPEKSITFIRAQVYDNKILLQKDPGYLSSLKVQSENDRKQLLDGDWDTQPEHLVLDGFNEAINKVSWFKIPDHWKMRAVGADFGSVNAAEVMLAEDPDTKFLYVFDEDYPGFSRATKDICNTIKAKCGMVPVRGCGGNKTVEKGSVESYKLHGIPMDLPDFMDVKIQYQCVNDEFREGRLFILDNCALLLDMIGNFERPKDDEGNVLDEINDTKFHLCAALRYIVSKLRPPKAKRQVTWEAW